MKILLVPTRPGWAFDHRAKDMLKLRMRGISFELKYLYSIQNKDQYDYDLIYLMTLSAARILHQKTGIPHKKMAAGITSLRSLERYRTETKQFKPSLFQFMKKLRGVNTASDEIISLFDSSCNVYKTRVGIHEDLFKPAERPRRNKTFKVGWVGRIDKPEYRQLKGYDLVVSALKGMDVKLEIRTYKENYVPRNQMARFYQGLDCFICSSQSEHIPLPILEAAACGVPIITTKVGIVPELIRNRKNGLIVERSSDAIKQAVQYLMKHPDKRANLSKNIRKTIEDGWTWERTKKDWLIFFQSI